MAGSAWADAGAQVTVSETRGSGIGDMGWQHGSEKKQRRGRQNMRTKLQIIAFAVSLVFIFQSQAQTGDAIFPKGEPSTVKNHTGDIWLKELNVGDSTFDPSIAVATDHGRHWLLSGKGEANTDRSQGRCNKVPSGSRALARCITQKWLCLYSGTPTQKGKTIWLEPVKEKDYNSVK